MKPFQINLIHFTGAKKKTISNLLVTTLDTVQSNKLHTLYVPCRYNGNLSKKELQPTQCGKICRLENISKKMLRIRMIP